MVYGYIFTYYICSSLLKLGTIPANVIAWILAVLFAYLTNRKWVFESYALTIKDIINEIIAFFSCRLLTGILDIVIMYIFVDIYSMNGMIIKCISNIIVIILNYVASKLFVFKK